MSQFLRLLGQSMFKGPDMGRTGGGQAILNEVARA